MKAFKRFAVVLAAASIATVSAATAAGCTKSSSSSKVATTANWNASTTASVEKNFIDYWAENTEVAEYALSFTEGSNNRYTVNYDTDKATYVTRLYLEKSYDWAALTCEAYRAEANESVYVYETQMTLSGSYKMTASGEEYAFNDSLKTVCKFRLAGSNLVPVYSKLTVKDTAAASLAPNKIENAYVKVDAVHETFYNYECTQATVYTTDNVDAKNTGVKTIKVKTKYSLFDNSQLKSAIRAFTMAESATRTFDVCVPQDGAVQRVTVTVASPATLNKEDEKQKLILDALSACTPKDYIFFDGTPTGDGEEKILRYSAVSTSINAEMKGQSPVYWYSTIENNDINGTRGVLLRMTTPLPFGLGTMDYTLKSLNVVKK